MTEKTVKIFPNMYFGLTHCYDEVPDNNDFKLHNHDDVYEIVLFLSGDSEFYAEGNVYKLKPYDMLITRPFEMHHIRCLSAKPYERIILYLSTEYFKQNRCEEFEDITYFDICIYLEDLKSNGYIKEIHEENNVLYSPTKEGVITLRELLELIPGVNLYNLKKMVNKNMVEVKTEYAIDTNIIPIKDGEFKVSCYIKDGNDELINITMYAGDKEQAKNISKNWANNSEKIYTTLLEMMTKEE